MELFIYNNKKREEVKCKIYFKVIHQQRYFNFHFYSSSWLQFNFFTSSFSLFLTIAAISHFAYVLILTQSHYSLLISFHAHLMFLVDRLREEMWEILIDKHFSHIFGVKSISIEYVSMCNARHWNKYYFACCQQYENKRSRFGRTGRLTITKTLEETIHKERKLKIILKF